VTGKLADSDLGIGEGRDLKEKNGGCEPVAKSAAKKGGLCYREN